MNLCSVDGCDRRVHGNGYCFMHYRRLRRSGTTERMSTEQRGRIASAILTGKKQSAETRAKRSAALKGRVFSAEHKAKISAGNYKGDLSARTGICVIAGCGKKEMACGWCYRHYTSNRKYGSPEYIESDEHRVKVSALRAQIQTGKIGHWRGKKRGPHSPEWSAKISAANMGKTVSAEAREKIAAKLLGRKRPPEVVAKLQGINMGRKMSEKNKERLRELWTGHSNPCWGRSTTHGPRTHWIDYNGVSLRSNYEVRFAKAMDARGTKWEYEPERFDLGECTYLPDFLLPDDGIYVEVKGWLDPKSQRKIALFRQRHPDLPLIVATDRALKLFESSIKTI